jgi:hypothetical protein
MDDRVVYLIVDGKGAVTVEQRFLGCEDTLPSGRLQRTYVENHIVGRDPTDWIDGARSFNEVYYEDIYPSIDLRFYFLEGRFKYDFVLERAGDAALIKMEYIGVEQVIVDDRTGELVVVTPAGSFRDTQPVLFQGDTIVPGGYAVTKDNLVAYTVPMTIYEDEPLVIDPGLLFCTYVCGGSWDEFINIDVDDDGYIYIVGRSRSDNFPVTPGVFCQTFNGGEYDGVLIKMLANGTDLVFSTYMGGPGEDVLQDIKVRPDGSILLMGYTDDPDFPTTTDAMNTTINGATDIFIGVMNSTGDRFTYCTFWGGEDTDYSKGWVFDDTGDVYFTGATTSVNLTCTDGAYCQTYIGGEQDAYLVKMDSSLKAVEYCTYFGGTAKEEWISIDVTPDGKVYLAGDTWSTDFPTTAGAFCQTKNMTDRDIFLASFDDQGDLEQCTLVVGNVTDSVCDIEILPDGRVVVVGYTSSPTFPFTDDANDTTLTGAQDGFLLVFDEGLSSLEYGTFIGGAQTGSERVYGLEVMPDGKTLAISGLTGSDNLNTTQGSFKPFRSDRLESFVAVVDIENSSYRYQTYIGGSQNDYSTWSSIHVDKEGYIYHGSRSLSTDLFITEGAYQTAPVYGWDSFIVKILPLACDVQGPPDNFNVTGMNNSVTLTWEEPEFIGCLIYSVRLYWGSDPDNLTYEDLPLSQLSYTVDDLTNGETYYFSISVVNTAGEGPKHDLVPAVPMDLPGPVGDMSVTYSLYEGTVNISWSRPSYDGGELLGYKVYRRGPDGQLVLVGTLTNRTWFVDDDPGMEYGEAYNYTVLAFNSEGDGPSMTEETIVPYRIPDPPRGFKLHHGDNSVNVVWQAPLEDGGSLIIGYRIFRGTSPESMESIFAGTFARYQFDDFNVTNGVPYYYYMESYTALGTSKQTATREVIPHRPPDEPRSLVANRGDGSVSLNWLPPLDDGGLGISGYLLYFGFTEDSIDSKIELANVTSYVHPSLTNGVTIYYQVSAITDTEGTRSDFSYATPMGIPDPPTEFKVESLAEGVVLTWTAPLEDGGSNELFYVVFRGLSGGTPTQFEVVNEGTEFVDTAALGNIVYDYYILAGNEVGRSDPTATMTVRVKTAPGPPVSIIAEYGEGCVYLNWTEPDDDGGSPITHYILRRGTDPSDLFKSTVLGNIKQYVDMDVENGTKYYYTVYARNMMGDGETTVMNNATPLAMSSMPLSFHVEFDKENEWIMISWEAPSAFGTADATAYQVYKGRSEDTMIPIEPLITTTSYKDKDIKLDKTYFYRVAAICEFGEGGTTHVEEIKTPQEERLSDAGFWPILLLILVVVLAVALVLAVQRSRRPGEGVQEAMTHPGGGIVMADLPVGEDGVPYYIVEEVFLVYKDGRLITDCARPECETADADLMSGMLIAVQGLIQDGLERGGTLESIKFGSNRVLLASGEHIHVAVVLYGRPTQELMEEITDLVPRIEGSYAGRIEEWIGDPDQLEGIANLLIPLLAATEHLNRDDVMPEEAEMGVKLLSAIDFHQGYVRLKMAAVNGTEEVIADAAMEFTYNHDMLRLERVEPGSLKVRGDRIHLGAIKPKEKLTVAFMFDPQICQETYIDGMLVYYDPRGELKTEQMKRRHADVVCPIFFTKEHANTAMLRRLIKEKLSMSDLRVFKYPQTQPPDAILKLAQGALSAEDMQMVRQFEEQGPPYLAEVWYYAETKVKGYQMVIRLGVLEESGTLEIFAASTSMEPITGLLADFRRELDRAMEKNFPEGVRMKENRDEVLRMELMQRPLMLDQTPEEE